jgi:hypothetical protein
VAEISDKRWLAWILSTHRAPFLARHSAEPVLSH